MNKLILVGLMCVPFYVHAADNAVIPHSSVALAESRAITKIKVANEIPLLTKAVADLIKTTADNGDTNCNLNVNEYHNESIHAVAVKLRAKGYQVKLIYNGWNSENLLVIDWSK